MGELTSIETPSSTREAPEVPSQNGATAALAPMQLGMLFQATRDGTQADPGVHVLQVRIRLCEQVDLAAFSEAWTTVARAHESLSTYFVWRAVPTPERRIARDVQVPVEGQDWSALSEETRGERLRLFLEQDRASGFDLARAPLLRVAVFAYGPRDTELVVTIHHIVVDGRGLLIALKNVFVVYDAIRDGRRNVHIDEAVTYGEYVHWLAARPLAESRAFFRSRLSEQTMPTPLPAAEPSHRLLRRSGYGVVGRYLPEHTVERLRGVSQRIGVGLGMVTATAWALLLHRYTRQRYVTFGWTRHCRRTALDGRARDLVGLLINSLPLRVEIREDDTLEQLVRRLAEENAAQEPHENTPLTEIQGESGVTRQHLLFESQVTFDNQGLLVSLRRFDEARFRDATIVVQEQPATPLNLLVSDRGSLEVRLLFDRRRFRQDAIEQLFAALVCVFEQLASGEHVLVDDVDVVPPDERERITSTWNATDTTLTRECLIQELFEARAALQPEAVAVIASGAGLDYASLDVAANRLAQALRAQGARRGTYVGVCLERSIDLVVAVLATTKAGAAYVPLDPRDPPARLATMLEDARASMVVTRRAHRGRFAGVTAISIDAQAADATGASPAEKARAEDPCYAIFTSGTTGKPNGVVLSHWAVVNTLDWVNRTFDVGPGDRLLFVTSPGFDLSVYDMFGVLGAGARIVIANDDEAADPAELARILADEGVTIWNSAPAAMQRLLDGSEGSSSASLRLVLLSGDVIPLPLPAAIRRRYPNARVISLGGATEASIWSNWFPITELHPDWTSVPYGRPIQNARYYALDERMRPVPVGVEGDLYIGGRCVADGYLNRRELTDARFVVNPFAPGRLYKTGDIVRYFPDGNLEFLGRSDFQVKVRGFRVELAEVERALLAITGLRQASCTAFLDASGEKALAAYVVADESGHTETSIKEHLRRNLPSFMVPARIVLLREMPLSPNGKIDRRALPPPSARHLDETSFVPPRDAREQRLVAVWERLLARRPIGVTDDFFDLGGHSLLALLVVARCRSELGVEISLPRFLEHPTIAGLLQAIDEDAEPERFSESVRVYHRAELGVPLVLVAGGSYLLLYHQLAKRFASRPVYVIRASATDLRTALAGRSRWEDEILTACRSPQVVVIGFRAGARSALSLAESLRRRGREVPLVALFDPEDAPSDDAGSSLRQRVASLKQRLPRALMRARTPAVVTSEFGGNVLMVLSEAASREAFDAFARDLGQRAGEVSALRVPGGHMGFLADDGDLVLRAICERIEASRDRAAPQ
jgi:amino acid adenylation domain-containing protein